MQRLLMTVDGKLEEVGGSQQQDGTLHDPVRKCQYLLGT